MHTLTLHLLPPKFLQTEEMITHTLTLHLLPLKCCQTILNCHGATRSITKRPMSHLQMKDGMTHLGIFLNHVLYNIIFPLRACSF